MIYQITFGNRDGLEFFSGEIDDKPFHSYIQLDYLTVDLNNCNHAFILSHVKHQEKYFFCYTLLSRNRDNFSRLGVLGASIIVESNIINNIEYVFKLLKELLDLSKKNHDSKENSILKFNKNKLELIPIKKTSNFSTKKRAFFIEKPNNSIDDFYTKYKKEKIYNEYNIIYVIPVPVMFSNSIVSLNNPSNTLIDKSPLTHNLRKEKRSINKIIPLYVIAISSVVIFFFFKEMKTYNTTSYKENNKNSVIFNNNVILNNKKPTDLDEIEEYIKSIRKNNYEYDKIELYKYIAKLAIINPKLSEEKQRKIHAKQFFDDLQKQYLPTGEELHKGTSLKKKDYLRKIYTVKKGDTFSSITEKYNTTQELLIKYNPKDITVTDSFPTVLLGAKLLIFSPRK